jgi:hypothetical protein
MPCLTMIQVSILHLMDLSVGFPFCDGSDIPSFVVPFFV